MIHGHWSDISRDPSILGVDARAYFPIMLWIVYPTKNLFLISVVFIVVFGVIAKLGYSAPVALRLLKSRLRGKVCHARPWWYRKRYFNSF